MCVAERKRIADCGDHQDHRSPKVTSNHCLIDSSTANCCNNCSNCIAASAPVAEPDANQLKSSIDDSSSKDRLSNDLTATTRSNNKTASNIINSNTNTNSSINNSINSTKSNTNTTTNNNNNNNINNTNANSNSTIKTNVMDKLDPSLHCFLSPSFFSLYSFSLSFSPGINELEPTSQEIAKKIEEVLKQKKIIRNGSDLPSNLTKKIAQDIMTMSETEPCGLQGCLLYISLEDEDQKCQLIDTLKLGEKTIVPTFVMYLHLRRRYSDWFKLIAARFFRHLFKDSYTLHDVYKLSKRKLFRTLSPTCKS